MSDLTIPPEVADKLGYYVYLYVDPRTDRPFYVGKGVKRRILLTSTKRGIHSSFERFENCSCDIRNQAGRYSLG